MKRLENQDVKLNIHPSLSGPLSWILSILSCKYINFQIDVIFQIEVQV